MKIFSISNMDIWMWGEGKGIPSIFFAHREFVKRGYEVHFLCPVREGEKRYSLYQGIHIHRFDFPFNSKKFVYTQTSNIFNRLKASIVSNLNWLFLQIFAFFWGFRLGIKIKPDIVYAHSSTSSLTAYLISRFLSTKLIIRVYGTRQLYWQWKHFWFRIKEFRDYVMFKIPADYFIITNDGSQGNLLARKIGVKENKIKYWRNGIDDDVYKIDYNARKKIEQYLNIKPSSKIIISTCRLIPDYRVDLLINTLADIFKKGIDIVCLIVGSGPEEKKIKEFVRLSNVSSRVFFLGIVDHNMINTLLYAGDIFVFLPHYHNCTNTMWEAMACGKCIITTETEAIKEVLTSGEDAVLIPDNKMSELPRILEHLLKNDNFREEIGNKARIRAKQILEPWEKRMDKEIKLLEDLLKDEK